MSSIKPSDYICIQGWMITKLGLKGNRLMLYALIHGYTRDGVNEFTGSLTYISDWLNCTRHTATDTLKSLTDDGLIIKREWTENNVRQTSYKVDFGKVAELSGGSAKIALPGSAKSAPGGSAKIAPNNIYNNILTPITPLKGERVRLSPEQEDRFERFWQAYPRKVNKQASIKAWRKLSPSEELLGAMLDAIGKLKNTDQWQRGVVPHPSTWLNNARWEDEIETDGGQDDWMEVW